MKFKLSCSVLIFAGLACAATTVDQSQLPPQLRGITIEQHLGTQLPLSAQFQDESGRTVPLSTFFEGKPVLLALVYYRCPMLCNQILSGVVGALRPLKLHPGRDFEVVAISIS